ncbi:tetratricopeptide repeat family protein [Yersinia ruckeri]|uniref:tetratricopeptide repeat protein n=1 Tax=Yersinia ruckeri TaxID=29486 RepID=UPI0005AD307B|nr:tetratricopeptide repeat family protein [Yersinia ruckeri]
MKTLLLLLTCFGSTAVYAQHELADIQNQWAVCQYQVAAKQKESCLEKLSTVADKASSANGSRADLLIWSAIIKSSWAGEKGGLGALDLVKDAKVKLELAIKLDANALDGSAYTSLGTLYYQVPGWPIGFGDKKQAEVLLKKALQVNPTGIDPNYFYGDFLLDQGRKADAKIYLQKALVAPARSGRELADKGRHQDIQQRLDKL